MSTEVTEVAKEVAPTLKEIATQLLSYVNSTADFVSEQAPLIAQEIINYGIGSYAVSTILFFTALVIIYKIVSPVWKQNLWDDEDRAIPRLVIGVSGGAFCFIAFIINLMGLIKTLVAPRLYLIEQLLQMAK